MNTSTETNKNAGHIILAQLGGAARLGIMIGAKNFMVSENSLSFKHMRAVGSLKHATTHVRITLDPSDTYTVEFIRVRGCDCIVERMVSDVYADSLRELFIRTTGLALSIR